MSIHRIDAKRDQNEPAIIAMLHMHGCNVDRLSDVGVPDLLCGLGQRWFFVEVKRDKSAKLTPAQLEFFAVAKHYNRPCFVVYDPDQVAALIHAVRNWDYTVVEHFDE